MGLVLVGSRAGAVSSLFRPTGRSDFEESLCEVRRLDHADVPEQLLTFGAQDEQRWHRDDVERLTRLQIYVHINPDEDESIECGLDSGIGKGLRLDDLAGRAPVGVEVDEYGPRCVSGFCEDTGDRLRERRNGTHRWGWRGLSSDSRSWNESEQNDLLRDLQLRDNGRVVADGEGVLAKIDFDFCDSGEPIQGRFDSIRSAKSGDTAAALHHPAHDERNRSQLAIPSLVGRRYAEDDPEQQEATRQRESRN